MLRKMKSRIVLQSNPAFAGIFRSSGPSQAVSMIENPRKNSTPKMIFDSGAKTRVATVTNKPETMIARPRLQAEDKVRSSRFSPWQNPLTKINSQQILCCQRYPWVLTRASRIRTCAPDPSRYGTKSCSPEKNPAACPVIDNA